ncbi:unnamed protein product [Gongylonema pulchrum]|uniref:Cilia- and flagella-associated protein 251-like n=1 Tax=Gongylonema pulchrum TaxID=637853 RepID=A0A183EHN1_9BILA|nr:unnamed protein product [Gongylonema pulchrum]
MDRDVQVEEGSKVEDETDKEKKGTEKEAKENPTMDEEAGGGEENRADRVENGAGGDSTKMEIGMTEEKKGAGTNAEQNRTEEGGRMEDGTTTEKEGAAMEMEEDSGMGGEDAGEEENEADREENKAGGEGTKEGHICEGENGAEIEGGKAEGDQSETGGTKGTEEEKSKGGKTGRKRSKKGRRSSKSETSTAEMDAKERNAAEGGSDSGKDEGTYIVEKILAERYNKRKKSCDSLIKEFRAQQREKWENKRRALWKELMHPGSKGAAPAAAESKENSSTPPAADCAVNRSCETPDSTHSAQTACTVTTRSRKRPASCTADLAEKYSITFSNENEDDDNDESPPTQSLLHFFFRF